MTLKEIYKIIDESHFYWLKESEYEKSFSALTTEEFRDVIKNRVKSDIKKGYIYVFIKLNNNNGEIEHRWVVDHIDTEKKIVKKKLDEMTGEEVRQLKEKLCVSRGSCIDCPFHNKFYCYGNFSFWKDRYEECKDKEFDVEVEE